jgi:serine phosphatase RsbU (regulator of sigma subunit)
MRYSPSAGMWRRLGRSVPRSGRSVSLDVSGPAAQRSNRKRTVAFGLNCGHPPPLRLAADGDVRALTPEAYATPLGLRPGFQPSTFSVSTGDRLLFYTDGLLEARDRAGHYFRLEEAVGTLRHPDLETAADGLLSLLRAHTGNKLDDDVALLLVEATSLVRRDAGP